MYRNPIELPPKTTVIYVDRAYLEAFGVLGFCVRTRKQAEGAITDVIRAVRNACLSQHGFAAPELWPRVAHYSMKRMQQDFANYKKQIHRAYATYPICFCTAPEPQWEQLSQQIELHERAHVLMFERMRRYGYAWIYRASKLMVQTIRQCRLMMALVDLENTVTSLYRRGNRTRRTYQMHMLHEILARVAVMLEHEEADWAWVGYVELGNQPSKDLVAVTKCMKERFGTFDKFIQRVDRMAAR